MAEKMSERSKDQSGQARTPTIAVTETPSLQLRPRTKQFTYFRKKHLGGRHFRTDAIVQQAILMWIHDHYSEFSYACFNKLVEQMIR
ncbi:hypothetical protein AVEN_80704-1 [Araneus ventricosus]|uniref:Uncharacterized protein n=1 Tax=Araneus ventricosus TaxID=182803 RepID=A0A4Y2WQQ6_ARAVE|nr:hypothetical protein AVEN_80704-1 [Araneus ventricosus]